MQAICLLIGGNLGFDNNWINGLNIGQKNQYIHYLYSYYFTTTTILTVGYGDITPKN